MTSYPAVFFSGLKCSNSALYGTSTQSSQRLHSSQTPTAGITVGVTVITIIPLVILAIIGYRYRRYNRCVWPNICKKKGLSITADDVLNDDTECEIRQSPNCTLAFTED